ncbi:hypothetical protein LUZ61_013841 [Rhynchospora tenuis]|uniref:BTB domain-containing protein n=1 Tax=Rhynchospora tenuis TaxID=198213 RepID=A0AAD5W9X9_9POAL|nr:hypothetical protein LUZ61_013841 [Rhynchospora tenuis]
MSDSSKSVLPHPVGDVDLEVRLYPVGEDKQVEIHVNLLSNAKAVTKFCYSILYYHNGQKKWIFSGSQSGERDFKANAIGEGTGLPMVRVEWFTKDFAEDDHVLFDLALWFALDDSKKVPKKPEHAVVHPHHPLSEVCPNSELLTALLNGDFADIHFVVGGQTFSAHRAVLAARSSVFRSEFLALKQDVSQKGVFVSIQHMDAFTFKQLLHFIYTDSLAPDFDQPATADILERIAVY